MIFLVIVLILVIIFLTYRNVKAQQESNNKTDDNKTDEIMPYNKKLLLTKNEWAFYKEIKPICDKNNLHIISKVRLADIVEVDKNIEYKERQKYFNKIKNKHIDFILCNPDNLAIIALVELDDKSHERKDREKSDEFKNKLFEKVGYKLIRARRNENFEKKLIDSQIIEIKEEITV